MIDPDRRLKAAHDKDTEMKVWIFFLVVLASASSVVNTQMAAPNANRPTTVRATGLD